MSVKEFELWLDESGTFDQNDMNKSFMPSLVGGPIIEKGKLSKENLRQFYINEVGQEDIHLNEMPGAGQFVLDLFRYIDPETEGYFFVVNEERMLKTNDDETYINLLSHGVTKLYEELAAKYADVKLKVIIARRMTGISNREDSMELQEYSKILKTKFKAMDLDKYMSENISIEISSARSDQRLMVSDAMCNFYYTRSKNHKYAAYKNDILSIINKKIYRYSVDEPVVTSMFKRYMLDERFENALYLLFTSNKISNKEDKLSIIIERLKYANSVKIDIIFRVLLDFINELIESKEFRQCEELITNIEEQFLKRIENEKIAKGSASGLSNFRLNLLLLSLTICTHTGNIMKSENLLKEFNDNTGNYINNFENINLFFILKNREGVHLQNIFDFEGSVKKMEELCNCINQLLEVLPMVDGLNTLGQNLKSSELLKAMGTKLYAGIFLIREKGDNSYIEGLRKDSDFLIHSFSDFKDKSRQYQYRALLENEAFNFSEAANFLALSLDKDDIDSVAEEMFSKDDEYTLMNYSKVMQDALIYDYNTGKALYNAFDKYKNINNKVFSVNYSADGYIKLATLWRVGFSLWITGKKADGTKFIDTAYKIAESNKNDDTLRIIELSILAAKAYILLKDKGGKGIDSIYRNYSDLYVELLNKEIPQQMKSYLDYFKVTDKEFLNEERLKKIMMKIRY